MFGLALYFPVTLFYGFFLLMLYFSFNDRLALVACVLAAAAFLAGLTLCISVFALRGVRKCYEWNALDWTRNWIERRGSPAGTPRGDAWGHVQHFVIIPNYKENLRTLNEMLDNLAQCELARTHLTVVLAMEERESNAFEKVQSLKLQHAGKFTGMFATYHPRLEDELAGKASNVKWAFGKVAEQATAMHLNDEDILLHICDADSLYHPRYFACLNYTFLTTPSNSRFNTIWQSPMVNYQNYNLDTFFTRIVSVTVTLHELACLSNARDTHFPFSTYSLSMVLAKEVGGWDGDVVAEDHHMFLKCFYSAERGCTVAPIFLPTMCYSVTGKGWMNAIYERWQQAQRHAMGVSEISYSISEVVSRGRYTWHSFLVWLKLLHVHFFVTVPSIMLPFNIIAIAHAYHAGQGMNIYPDTPLFPRGPVALESHQSFFTVFHVLVFTQVVTACFMFMMVFANYRLLQYLLKTARMTPIDNEVEISGNSLEVSLLEGENEASLFKGLKQHTLLLSAQMLLFAAAASFLFHTTAEYVAVVRILALERFEYRTATKAISPGLKPALVAGDSRDQDI